MRIMNERRRAVKAGLTTAENEQNEAVEVGVNYARFLATKILTPYLKLITRRYLRLKPAQLSQLPGPTLGKDYTLYLHVPFCESLCPYCSFNRFIFDEEKARKYYHDLRQEMQFAHDLGYDFTSLYIGGGTPTIVIDELCVTIDFARKLFPIQEVSCETNPNHLIPEFIQKLQGRVQRLSVGVQSFDNELLQQMGRYQKFGSGEEVLQRIREAAPLFPSLNVDMIFNFPNQTVELLEKDIQFILDSGAQQTTFYPLMTSPSVSRALSQSVGRVDYGREPLYYEIILKRLSSKFKLISAWTFLRNGSGMIDEYIVDSDEYVGLGAGAFSFLNGTLYVNTFSPREYGNMIAAGKMSVLSKQSYGKREQMRYRFLMELFSLSFDRERFKRLFGKPVEIGLLVETAFMWLTGAFASMNRRAITLTPRGKYLSVVMMREFFSGVNNVRDEARRALSEDEALCAFPLQGDQLTVGETR